MLNTVVAYSPSGQLSHVSCRARCRIALKPYYSSLELYHRCLQVIQEVVLVVRPYANYRRLEFVVHKARFRLIRSLQHMGNTAVRSVPISSDRHPI